MTVLSYQLYSSRHFPPVLELLHRVAKAGLTAVEGYGALYDQVDALAEGITVYDLAMPTAQIGLPDLEADAARVLALATRLGWQAVFLPHLPPEARPADATGWADFGKHVDRLGQPIRDAGLTFGWHNHDFEFQPLPCGRKPLEVLLEAAPNLSLELDLGWVVRSGEDPLFWIDQYPDRIAAVHVKDVAPAEQNTDEDGWADIGAGVVDWPSVLAAVKNVPFWVLEHDNPSDDDRFLRASVGSMRDWGLA